MSSHSPPVREDLLRLVLDFRGEELVLRCLYRSESGAEAKGTSNPGTKRRRVEVQDLVVGGLQDALKALEGHVDVVGSSGFTQREDILQASVEGAA